MQLSDFYAIDTAGLQISAEQASNFAKTIAGDFNPLHDPDNRRFCVPGDLLFTALLQHYGISQRMHFRFSGMVGADLANLINEAALLAVRRGKKRAGMPEFEEAIERVVAGLEKKNRLINPKEREIVAYHEMGHAIVASSLPGTDPVKKISIIPRGIAALGYTMQTPTEDRFLMNKSELFNRIATLLGGRAAEEIVFEDISTGAHNDLARATDIARSMVKEYGMSAKVGQIYFAREKRNQFLNIPTEGAVEYSEATAELIDSEVREIINNQYKRTMEILREKRDTLENGAKILLEKEKIEGDELNALMEMSSSETPKPTQK